MDGNHRHLSPVSIQEEGIGDQTRDVRLYERRQPLHGDQELLELPGADRGLVHIDDRLRHRSPPAYLISAPCCSRQASTTAERAASASCAVRVRSGARNVRRKARLFLPEPTWSP